MTGTPVNAAPVNTRLLADLGIAHGHAAYPGHFPGFPILPGAALLDAAVHEIIHSRGLDLCLWHVATVKFLRIVRPGDSLTLEHSATNAATIRFAVRSKGNIVVTGTLNAHGD